MLQDLSLPSYSKVLVHNHSPFSKWCLRKALLLLAFLSYCPHKFSHFYFPNANTQTIATVLDPVQFFLLNINPCKKQNYTSLSIWNFTLGIVAFPHISSTQLALISWIFGGLQFFVRLYESYQITWMLSPLLFCLFILHFISHFPMPCLFNQRSFLCFASQTRAENFPNHHLLSKTVGPSPNLRGAGVGAVRGSTRRCCSSAELC